MMKTTPMKWFLVCTALFCSSHMMAEKYDEYAKKVRESVWAWEIPEFNNYDVPDEYKNESAIILAMHDRIIASAQRRLRFGAQRIKINKELLYEKTHRRMIKINDKVSLEKYATLSFREQEKVWGYMMSSTFKTIIGVRIIKPDGTIKEIDVSEEAVNMTEGKRDRTDYKKLAISDLQVGDVLDYFTQDEGHIDTQNIPPFDIIFADRYPILFYSVYCEADKRLTTEYRPVNGAPDFTVSTNKDGDAVLEVQLTHIPKYKGYDRWVSERRTYPMMRMAIMNNTSKAIWKPKSARGKGLYKNVAPSTIIDDAKNAFGNHLAFMKMDYRFQRLYRQIKEYKKKHPQMSKEELAAYIYDRTRYEENFRSPQDFIEVLHQLLVRNGINTKLAFVSSRFNAPADEFAHRYDLNYFLFANDGKQLFSFSSYYSMPNEVDPDFEGETALTLTNPKHKGWALVGEEGTYTVPISTAGQHKAIVTLDVHFLDEDPLTLELTQENVISGALKQLPQMNFSTTEKWHKEMREKLMITKSVQEELDETRSSRKYINDYNEMLEEQRRILKDKFIYDLNNYHGSDPKELLEYEVVQMGVTQENPDLIYRQKYLQDGLVQKAGNNYILNAGKLIGSQLEIRGDERNRDIDAYLGTARTFQYLINIAIPEGYSMENTDGLRMEKENALMAFTASAKAEGQTLRLNVSKTYKQPFIAVRDFAQLLEILDSAVEFTNQSIILKKQ